MDVSIIIINYNTTQLLIDAIDSIFAKTDGIKYEIIVVDNNSLYNPRDILAEKYGGKVVYLGLSENIGFGRANNEGIKIAKGRNIFLLNPDTILINNAVKILSNFLDENEDVGVCGGNLYDGNRKPTISFDRKYLSIRRELDLLFLYVPSRIFYGKNIYFNYTEKNIDVKVIIGADMMIRKRILEITGLFDPDFFMYHEELELCHRITLKKYKIKNVPCAKITHLEGRSFTSNLDRQKRLLEARRIFYKKTYSNLYCFIADCIFHLAAISRIITFFILRNKEKIFYWKYTLRNI